MAVNHPSQMQEERTTSPTALPSPQTTSNGSPIVKPTLHPLYEELTETWQFIVACPTTRVAVIIDSHLDNNPSSTAISTIAADRALAVVQQQGYTVQNVLSTHEDPRYPSAAWYLRTQLLQSQGFAPHIAADRSMTALQRVLRRKYSMNDDSEVKTDFTGMFRDGQVFAIGELRAQVLHLADGSFAFVVGDLVFAGVADLKYQLRHRHGFLIGSLKDYRMFTSYDSPPTQKARLMPVMSGDGAKQQTRKLVIRYPTE